MHKIKIPLLYHSYLRLKVPQGTKSGTESPKQTLLDYDKALPGYYSRRNCISVIRFGCISLLLFSVIFCMDHACMRTV